MSISDFCNEVNELWWGNQVPTEAPRHIFALYVAAYEASLSPEQFLKFMGARNFISTTTAVLKNEKVAFSDAQKFLETHRKELPMREALSELFTEEQVKDEHKHVFRT